jgi:hypothetical protein
MKRYSEQQEMAQKNKKNAFIQYASTKNIQFSFR